MARTISVELEMPDDMSGVCLPAGVQSRLQFLLDRQDQGIQLTDDEREEAEGLVDIAELLSLLKLRAKRVGDSGSNA